jgi:GNAT superfamily N-acetyltransferase
MLIRRACVEDTVAACDVMRRSIAELCKADHHDDPAIVGGWLANKTPENVKAWIEDEDNRVLVAVEGNDVLAVGAVRKDGEITLNYVSPDARFKRISRAMLAALEQVARELGNGGCHLTSTETAFRFYLSAGYRQAGPAQGQFGTASAYPMTRRFAAEGVRAVSPRRD